MRVSSYWMWVAIFVSRTSRKWFYNFVEINVRHIGEHSGNNFGPKIRKSSRCHQIARFDHVTLFETHIRHMIRHMICHMILHMNPFSIVGPSKNPKQFDVFWLVVFVFDHVKEKLELANTFIYTKYICRDCGSPFRNKMSACGDSEIKFRTTPLPPFRIYTGCPVRYKSALSAP